jgi:hypothetical protein
LAQALGHDDGARYTTAGDHGWSSAAVIAVALGALLVLLLLLPWQRRVRL